MGLAINLSLCLPRDEVSVPVVRHICSVSMREIGVRAECIDAINLALTEACSNVVEHSHNGESYEVDIAIDDDRCAITVKDLGDGFDAGTAAQTDERLIDLTAESGRGIGLMKILVDRVKFEACDDDGMVVHLEKDLEFEAGHPAQSLLGDGDGGADTGDSAY